MNSMTRNVCELLPSEVCDLYARRPGPVESRTLVKRYILDPVLPVLMLLSMSVLTVVMLVTIVTAVADMDPRPPDGYVSVDPWAGAATGSAGAFYQDQEAYANSAAALETMEDGNSNPGPQAGDPF